MTANPALIAQRGISKVNEKLITEGHDTIHDIFDKRLGIPFSQAIFDRITEVELELQKLWGFPQDTRFHTHAPLYKFITTWAGRTFKCNQTGVEMTLGVDLHYRQYIPIGNCAIDLGMPNSYHRMIGDISEITKEGVEV